MSFKNLEQKAPIFYENSNLILWPRKLECWPKPNQKLRFYFPSEKNSDVMKKIKFDLPSPKLDYSAKAIWDYPLLRLWEKIQFFMSKSLIVNLKAICDEKSRISISLNVIWILKYDKKLFLVSQGSNVVWKFRFN